jgi:rubrerythrin
MPEFNLESYIEHSKKVDVSDMDFSQAPRYPLSDEEVRCLSYMMDIEAHTIVYLKGILSTCAVRDPRTTSFLSCWAYEEFFHGHTLKRFLEAAGVAISPLRTVEVQRQASWRDWIESIGASLICQISKHFHAVYLTWGAISELTTLEGYGILAARTRHPLLADLLRRLAKDERRHFAFYYNQAQRFLQARIAQRLTRGVLEAWWRPVGFGIHATPHAYFMVDWVYGDDSGRETMEKMDATMGKLPGLAGLDLFAKFHREAKRYIAERREKGLGFDDWVPVPANVAG